MYKLIEPKKTPLIERIPFYLFAGLMVSFLLWITLIRPLSMPADQMPFIFEYDETTKQVTDPEKQKLTYALLTGGAILTAGLAVIPVIRNDQKHNYALAKLWVNREYLDDGEFEQTIDILKPYTFKNNGADKMLAHLQSLVDKHKGKHIVGRKYFKPEYVKDLEKE